MGLEYAYPVDGCDFGGDSDMIIDKVTSERHLFSVPLKKQTRQGHPMTNTTYETRVRDSFTAVVSIQEAVSNQPKKLLETLFTLHPDVLMNGYTVQFVGSHAWTVRTPSNALVFSGPSALSVAYFLHR
jgi:hypothetical protein